MREAQPVAAELELKEDANLQPTLLDRRKANAVIISGLLLSGSAFAEDEEKKNTLREIDDKTFEEISLKSGLPGVVMFTSSSCVHCKRLEPFLVALREKYTSDIEITKFDLEKTKKDVTYRQKKDKETRPAPFSVFFSYGTAHFVRTGVPGENAEETKEAFESSIKKIMDIHAKETEARKKRRVIFS